MHFRILSVIAALAWSASALAQNVTVVGPVTPGHGAVFNSPTVLRDGGGTGVAGPATSVVGDLALWNNTTGSLLQDGGNLGTVNGNYIWSGNQIYNVTDGGLNSQDLTPWNFILNYDQNIGVAPGFSDANAMQITMTADHGSYVEGNGTNSKTTFIGLLVNETFRAAGQRFIFASNLNCVGTGDCATYGANTVTYATYPRNGDEGAGWALVQTLNQPNSTSIVTVVSATRNTCNTTTTQSVTGSATQQTVNVASGTGCTAGTWIVVNHEAATVSPNHEAVKIISSTSTSITGIFWGNYNNGTTITPGVDLVTSGGSQYFGEGRVVVDLTTTPYTTGTVSSIVGAAFNGSGTGWSSTMLSGGTTLVPGCITLAADDFTGAGFAGGGTNTLHDYYQIVTVTNATTLSILSSSVANNSAYKGKGPGSGAYRVLPCAEVLRVNINNNLGEVILDSNGFAWNVNDTLEESIPPYPDVSGFQYHFGAWSAGGTYRSFLDIANLLGSRQFQTAIQIRAGTGWGQNGADSQAYGIGVSISGAATGLVIGGSGSAATTPTVASISLPCGVVCDSSATDLAGAITWGPVNNAYIQPNHTNNGMDFHMISDSNGPKGILSGIQGASNGLDILLWQGISRLLPETFASLPTCASGFEGTMAAVHDANTATWGATITAGGSTNQVMALCDGANWTVMGK